VTRRDHAHITAQIVKERWFWLPGQPLWLNSIIQKQYLLEEQHYFKTTVT
jgi:hypothetical protein